MRCSPTHSRMKAAREARRYLAVKYAIIGLFTCLLAQAQFKPAASQEEGKPRPKDLEAPTFSAQVNLVRILTTVRDSSGAIVANLSKTDFSIQDSGVDQKIAVFERNTSLPLSIAILVDTSGSTQSSLPYERQSIRRFLGTLIGAGNTGDAFELFSFNWRTNLEVDFTRNAKRGDVALKSLHGDGGTSLYDALFLASDTLADREGRHVMIIVTDGGDTTSYKKYHDALAAAQQVDAVVYPIVVVPVSGDAGRNLGGEHALSTLAASTGGRAFSPQGAAELDRVFIEIVQELRTQYLLGFYPQNVMQQPRSFHSVKVRARPADLHVAARSGYYEP